MEANALAPRDTTIELRRGRYILTGVKNEDRAASGDLDLNGGSRLTIVGFGPGETVLDGGDVDRIFHLGPVTPAHLVLEGVTVQNGNAVSVPGDTRTGGNDVGGGIRIEKDSGLAVTNAIFQDNKAFARAGAIGMPPSAATVAGADRNITTTLNRVTLKRNVASTEGGAIFNNRNAFFENVIFEDNVVDGPGCAPPPASQALCPRGGAIAQSGDLTLTDVIVRRNAVENGTGGGVATRGDPAAQIFGTIRMNRVTVSENSARVGGGVGVGNGAFGFLTNTTISANTAGGHPTSVGGGVVNAGTTELTNVTISGNSAPVGGGVVTVGPPAGAGNANTILRSTLLMRGAVGDNCLLPPNPVPFARAPISGGDNISSDNSCNLAGPNDRNAIDPMLGPLADNGGFTPTHALLLGSPAVDTVSNNPCPPPSTDQRGVTRPQGARCDIGAYEAAAAPGLSGGVVAQPVMPGGTVPAAPPVAQTPPRITTPKPATTTVPRRLIVRGSKVRLTCKATCAVRITARVGGRSTVVAQGNRSGIRLTAAGRKALRRSGRAGLKVQVRLSSGGRVVLRPSRLVKG